MLRASYPNADVHLHNQALAGETSHGGVKRLQEDVLACSPDLVTIAYGMNDQNRQPDGQQAVPVERFTLNLSAMITGIKEHTQAEIMLITPCLPNPRWMFASRNVLEYAEAIRRIAHSLDVPVADVQRIWQEEIAAGKSHESLLLNNLNHPNDYGHALYDTALSYFLK